MIFIDKNIMEKKKCTKCLDDKELSEFYKNNKSKDGLKSCCIVCHKKDSQSREHKYNEQRRLYREANKEEYREKKKQYYVDNKEKVLTENALWRQTFNGRLLSYKRSAIKRNIEWSLSNNEFESFWNQPCSYCGIDIETIGIDRVDNNIGYLLNNCTSCCSDCNTMKMSLNKTDFINKIKQILKNLNNG